LSVRLPTEITNLQSLAVAMHKKRRKFPLKLKYQNTKTSKMKK